MTELVPQETAITYPGDFMGAKSTEELYHMLGLDCRASEQEIKKKARKMLGEYHPDQGGDISAYKTIRQVRDILTGEALKEPEFADLEEFKEWQEAEEFFDNPSYEINTDVTDITDLAHSRFRAKKDKLDFEKAVEERDSISDQDYQSRYEAIQTQRENADNLESAIEATIAMEKFRAEVYGKEIDEEELEENIKQGITEKTEEKKERVKDSVTVKRGGVYMSSDGYPSLAEAELTDITVHGDITFVKKSENQDFGVSEVKKEKEGVIQTTLAGKNKLRRSKPVHCKVPKGRVNVEDSELEGVIQVLEGSVDVEVDGFSALSSAPVVRANAPEVTVKSGYEERGEIYVPESREDFELSDGEVDLDIAVMDGEITLENSRGSGHGSSSKDFLDNLELNKKYKESSKKNYI